MASLPHQWCEKHAREQDRLEEVMKDLSISNEEFERQRDEYTKDREACEDCNKEIQDF